MAKKIELELDVDTKGAQDSLGELKGSVDSATGGMVTKFNGVIESLKKVALGFRTIGGAIAASGIGLLLVTLAALRSAFTSSVEGQQKWAKILAVSSSIIGNLNDLLADLGEWLINIFENPQDAIKSFGKLLEDQIIVRFKGFFNLIPNLSKAIEQLLKGNFVGAAKIAGDAVGQVVLGVESITTQLDKATEAAKRFGEELAREAEIAGMIADKRAAADNKEIDLILKKAKAERERADLLEKAQQRSTFTTEERIKMLEEASRISDVIAKQEQQIAELRRDAIIEENKLSRTSIEGARAEEEAKAAVFEIETARLVRQKELTGQIQALLNEQRAANKAFNDTTIDEEEEMLDVKEIANDSFFTALRDKRAQDLADIKTVNEEIKKSNNEEHENTVRNIENEIALEQKKYEAKVTLLQMGYNAATAITSALESIGLLSAKKAFKINKAIGITQATVDGILAVQKTFKEPSLPFPANVVAATLMGVTAAANVAKIASTKFDGGGNTSVAIPTIPSFQSVASPATSQDIANLNQNQQPIQAYVTATDVSNALEARKFLQNRNKL